MNPHEEYTQYAKSLYNRTFPNSKIRTEIVPVTTHTEFKVFERRLYKGVPYEEMIGFLNITDETFNPLGTETFIPLS